MKPIDYIIKLSKTKSLVRKRQILQEAFDEGCIDLFEGLHLGLNPLIEFDLLKVPKIIDHDEEPDQINFDDFKKFAHSLHSKTCLNPKADIDKFINLASVASWNTWYRNILLKNVHTILPTPTFNKFLNQVNQPQHLVPILKCPKPNLKNPATYTGEYLIDEFITGQRLLIVMSITSTRILMFDDQGTRIHKSELSILSDILQYLPKDVILDGVFNGERYYIFDLAPLEDFINNTQQYSQKSRHQALCELQDLLIEQFGGKIRILPKKSVTLTTIYDLNTVKDEFRLQGIKKCIIKHVNGVYSTNAKPSWFIETV